MATSRTGTAAMKRYVTSRRLRRLQMSWPRARRSTLTLIQMPEISVASRAKARARLRGAIHPRTKYNSANTTKARPDRPSQSSSVWRRWRTASDSRLGDGGLFFFRLEIMFGQAGFQNMEGGIHVVGELE